MLVTNMQKVYIIMSYVHIIQYILLFVVAKSLYLYTFQYELYYTIIAYTLNTEIKVSLSIDL